MRRKIFSLLITVLMLLSCVMLPLANADAGSLGNIDFTQTFDDDQDILLGDGYTDADIRDMTGVPLKFIKNTAQSPVSVSIQEEEDGNKVLRLITSQTSDQIYPHYELETPISAGTIDTSFELLPEDGGKGSWSMYEIYNESNVEKTTIRFQGTWFEVGPTSKPIVTPQKNDKGRFCLRMVISRSDESNPWDVEIFDAAKEDQVSIYKTTIAADYGAIKSFKSFRVYAVDPGYNGIFDNYKVKITYLPTVSGEGLDNADPVAPELIVGFSNPISNPDEKVTIKTVNQSEEIVIDTEAEYYIENNEYKMKIKPKSFLAYGTDYKLVFESGSVINHSFRTQSAPVEITKDDVFYVPDGGVGSYDRPQTGTYTIKSTDDGGNGTIVIKNLSAEAKLFKVIIMAYDSDGVVIGSATRDNVRVLGGREYSVKNLTISDLDAEEVADVEVVVWEEISGGYVPIG